MASTWNDKVSEAVARAETGQLPDRDFLNQLSDCTEDEIACVEAACAERMSVTGANSMETSNVQRLLTHVRLVRSSSADRAPVQSDTPFLPADSWAGAAGAVVDLARSLGNSQPSFGKLPGENPKANFLALLPQPL